MNLESLPYTEIAKIIIPGIIAFLSGRYLSRGSLNVTAARESFNELYNPMYKLLRPYIYKKMENDFKLKLLASELRNLLKNKEHLLINDLDVDLEILFNSLESNDREYQKMFNIVCFSIEQSYLKLKSRLGYSTRRNITYRIRDAKLARMKARLKRIDILIGELFFVIASIVLLILVSKMLYDLFVNTVNWITNLIS